MSKIIAYRITTVHVYNRWMEHLFDEGTVVECEMDFGGVFMARELGTKGELLTLPKEKCRELTNEEKEKHGIK